MRASTILLPLFLFACGSPRIEAPPVPAALDAPAPFEIAKEVSRSSDYGRNDDLVESLFKETLLKDTALAELWLRITEQEERHNDSLETFDRFVENDRRYYVSAGQHVELIHDSLLKGSMLVRWQKDQRRFEDSVKPWAMQTARYDSIHQRSQDLMTAIKLDRTLRTMRDYQDKNRPDDKMFRREIDRLTAIERELMGKLGL